MPMILDVVKVLVPFVLSFFIGIALTPLLTNWLYANRMWKKKSGKKDAQGNETTVFNKLHETREVGTPRMGGIVIWGAAALTIGGIWVLAQASGNPVLQKLDFLSRSQTWLPLAALLVGAIVGLIDDFLEIKGTGSYMAGGLSLGSRLAVVALMGLGAGSWFFFKLDVTSIALPGDATLYLGYAFILVFALVMMALYAGGVIDGIDGLAGGVFATIFTAYAGIAFYQNQINLAAFCAVMTGAILAFLWFNIPPARFYMSETGSMALTTSLAIVAFMTDELGGGEGVLILPIIAILLVVTVGSNIVQVISKRLRGGQKVFKVAPIHHHFEAIGWPPYKVTMRFWIISVVFAILGTILALLIT